MAWTQSHVMGETKILSHCTFTWREPLDPVRGPRVYEVLPHHCQGCIDELERNCLHFEDHRPRLERQAK